MINYLESFAVQLLNQLIALSGYEFIALIGLYWLAGVVFHVFFALSKHSELNHTAYVLYRAATLGAYHTWRADDAMSISLLNDLINKLNHARAYRKACEY